MLLPSNVVTVATSHTLQSKTKGEIPLINNLFKNRFDFPVKSNSNGIPDRNPPEPVRNPTFQINTYIHLSILLP